MNTEHLCNTCGFNGQQPECWPEAGGIEFSGGPGNDNVVSCRNYNGPLCEVCGRPEEVGAACVPGVPMSVSYCGDCLEANAHPWGILVAGTAMNGGYGNCADWWREMVDCTIKHLGRTKEQFDTDVVTAIEEITEHERKEAMSEEGEVEVIKTQDPKYVIIDGKLCNAVTHKPIPDNEPVFILRAKDNTAAKTLKQYAQNNLGNSDQVMAVMQRLDEFKAFAAENPDAMKTPDTVLKDGKIQTDPDTPVKEAETGTDPSD